MPLHMLNSSHSPQEPENVSPFAFSGFSFNLLFPSRAVLYLQTEFLQAFSNPMAVIEHVSGSLEALSPQYIGCKPDIIQHHGSCKQKLWKTNHKP